MEGDVFNNGEENVHTQHVRLGENIEHAMRNI
jgi:hypothetical protein